MCSIKKRNNSNLAWQFDDFVLPLSPRKLRIMLQIRCKNNNITKSFPEGTSLLEVYQDYAEELKMPFPVVSAKVNNTSQGLKFRLFQNRDVEFLDAREGSGRRIIRDYNKGAYTAQETISQWHNVCEAEDQWIAPFQETADVMFNSALNIEFAVLRPHAELILAAVPRNCPEYAEAHRLLKFLHYFIPISDREIPPTSIMREFVGGSSFKY